MHNSLLFTMVAIALMDPSSCQVSKTCGTRLSLSLGLLYLYVCVHPRHAKYSSDFVPSYNLLFLFSCRDLVLRIFLLLMDVSRHILVLDTSILESINMNRREYNFWYWCVNDQVSACQHFPEVLV
jgi:hypothetical protein